MIKHLITTAEIKTMGSSNGHRYQVTLPKGAGVLYAGAQLIEDVPERHLIVNPINLPRMCTVIPSRLLVDSMDEDPIIPSNATLIA
jgi:hypothetical protein